MKRWGHERDALEPVLGGQVLGVIGAQAAADGADYRPDSKAAQSSGEQAEDAPRQRRGQGARKGPARVIHQHLGLRVNLDDDLVQQWVRRDIGAVYVQTFETALANFYGEPGGMCAHAETCGLQLALGHIGDLCSCGHYVEPGYLLGNINDKHMLELIVSPQQRQFGHDKRDALTWYCLDCDVRVACTGGCPKDRFTTHPTGEPGLHYLCPATSSSSGTSASPCRPFPRS
jgi:radical SAM protein with 4Fe4S-binding SPASM domain